eukprot:scaffold2045_cov404-Prasinococcus_capsulatus_cf.AAC.4
MQGFWSQLSSAWKVSEIMTPKHYLPYTQRTSAIFKSSPVDFCACLAWIGSEISCPINQSPLFGKPAHRH